MSGSYRTPDTDDRNSTEFESEQAHAETSGVSDKITYPREPAVDKRGRILDPNSGRPLRDRDNRPYGSAPFKGKPGKLNRKVVARLGSRVRAFEEQKETDAIKRPGSQKKS